MNTAGETYLAELHTQLADLRKDGGLVSPSIYDTAQVLRLAPPAQATEPAWDWLIAQQRPDGGWGSPAAPRARDLPSLAAVLALHTRHRCPHAHAAMNAGLAFLRDHATQHWCGPLPEDLPVGVELLLPQLLNTARRKRLSLPQAAYAPLRTLGERRRRLIAAQPPQAGSTSAHSWEAWGHMPDPALVDGSGGVGHSPAATAAWLRAAAGTPELAGARARARHYLDQAAAATGIGLPGVMPTVWPIARFEHVWSLYSVCVAGLLTHPRLEQIVGQQLNDLIGALQPLGMGMSDNFMQDGDITATAIATLKSAGQVADDTLLRRFQCGDHFYTYPNELQLSLTTTAHAIHALALAGADVARPARFLIARQTPDGRWFGDKWHSSWLYTTSQIMIALARTGYLDALPAAVDALMTHQRADGGWGSNGASTIAETAYIILALAALAAHGICTAAAHASATRATAWLRHQYEHASAGTAAIWIGKELYCPYRVDQVFVLSALLARSSL